MSFLSLPRAELKKKVSDFEELKKRADAGDEKAQRQLKYQGKEFKPLMESNKQRILMRAMYESTQERLQKAGFRPDDVIRLRRGVALPNAVVEGWKKGDVVSIKGNALESWTVGRKIADAFAMTKLSFGKTGVVLEMDVPIKTIVSTARTGFGCLREGEFVVLGSPKSKAKVLEAREW